MIQSIYNVKDKNINNINIQKSLLISFSTGSSACNYGKFQQTTNSSSYFKSYVLNSLCNVLTYNSASSFTYCTPDNTKIQYGIIPGSVVVNDVITDDLKNNLVSGSNVLGYVNYQYGLFILYDSYDLVLLQYDINLKYVLHVYTVNIDKNVLNDTTNLTNYDFDGYNYVKKKDIQPYITTVLLYNLCNELMATAKLVNPIKKLKLVDMNIQINLSLF